MKPEAEQQTETRDELQVIPEQTLELEGELGMQELILLVLYLEYSRLGIVWGGSVYCFIFWRIIALQCVGFCHTKCESVIYIYN